MAGECILCGKCLEICPLLAATGREELGPRAKADLCYLLGRDEAGLRGADVARLAGLCLGCGRCAAVCSQGVDVPGLVAGLRGAHPEFRHWLWRAWLTHADALWPAGSAAARLVPESLRPDRFGSLLRMLAGLGREPGLTPFLTPTTFPDTHRGEPVLLFPGCTATLVRPGWLAAARRLLDGLGADILPGDFRCCGGGLKSAGFANEARNMARHNINVWRGAGRPRVAVFCASCQSALRGYGAFFEDAAEAGAWQSSLIVLSMLAKDIGFALSGAAPERIGYHRPCHAEGADSDRLLLAAALGDRLVTATDRQCCGFGGVMRLGAPELGDQVGRVCWDRLAGAELALTGCSACAAQLAAAAPRGVAAGHWLEAVG
ncbi:4Fe-4S dicluster domain-containing protein [Pseudodesulfovibrio sp. F-1]|uniref:4Fe-4S dicluster domain-containing protein n=1 Tax=Pseudodesulfovibrio alkaliphilus TaxID=2661613 RepID=A0A7K1KNW6_9BACT|nr:4Fe-4S dicluster domain-containing protein [Pseudodesulfovibrio alkaliphilus]